MSERSYVILGILFFILGALITLYVWGVSVLASRDYLLEQLQEQTHALHNQNLELEDQLLHDESYTTIYTEASSKGYRPATYIQLQ